MTAKESIRINVGLPGRLGPHITKAARIAGMSVSGFSEHLIREAMAKGWRYDGRELPKCRLKTRISGELAGDLDRMAAQVADGRHGSREDAAAQAILFALDE